ncbi:peptidoglycan recognition protein 1-like [Lineus longissimus]|uniref:peptidoglycan recognition protein 1-like n=1 Tax=Lineus longissimus TaxID=88925 RepID=UPI002B4D81DD
MGTKLVFCVAFFLLVGRQGFADSYVMSSRTACVDVTRQGWHARPPKSTSPLNTPVGMVFIHHSAMMRCSDVNTCAAQVRAIQNFHMDVRGWDDIGYSFLVGEDGNVYEGRGWDRIGAHTYGYNDVAIGICVMGDFTTVTPNTQALDAVKNLIACGVRDSKVTTDYKLYGHRDSKKSHTECPGQAFYDLIRGWPHYDTHGPPP